MRLSDTMFGVLLLLFGVAVGLYAQTFPDIPGQRYGAAAFPTAIAIGFAGCGLAMLVRGLRTASGPLFTRTEWTRKPGALTSVLVTILCVVAYILLARRVGFIPMAVVILIVLFRMLRVPWWQSLLLAVLAAFACDYVFRSILLVPLPFGLMPRLPW
ncbi:tripartite tricarboxylate transporter TctB family protein [Mesorhizobium microcysteis]|uniref:Tripartite tricarboxylate transporter TctB family protein n=1 Tax=Neoaquamicrobium microcysteis TaxID=2682781 RepID=A0A5D4GMJ5_9HYPH|nr:tripartite tricarboxylate transporter TctB family protein [Mesorhizobium microcysteis]TYR30061.1 tripartite tricarboxylate transporter TctB family protein [Mesorhizobium microcysteis]